MGRTRILGSFALGLLLVAACGDEATGPQFEPVVVAEADSFSFQAVGFVDATDTRDYQWHRPGGTATVENASDLTVGAGSLTIIDSQGTELYAAPLASSGSGTTAQGGSGPWTVRVAVTGATGAVRFRLKVAYIGTPGVAATTN